MYIEEHADSINACRFCFMCRHVDPVGVVTCMESDTPRGIGLEAFRILKGYEEYTPSVVDNMYHRALDGMCHDWCVGNYKPHAIVLAARQDIVEKGMEPKAVSDIKDSVEKNGNPFGLAADKRFEKVEGAVFSDKCEVLYFAGCEATYMQPTIASSFIKILKAAGVDFSLLKDESESSKILTVLGYKKQAADAAKKVAAAIKATGCKTLVVASPSDYDAFKNDYPAFGCALDGVEIVHASEYAEKLIADGKVKLSGKFSGACAVQDSDYLCRFNDVCEAPRKVLAAAGAEIKTMQWEKKQAHSCGEAGGALRLVNPQITNALAVRAAKEATDFDADTLVVTCPVTKQTLVEAGVEGVKVIELSELVAGLL